MINILSELTEIMKKENDHYENAIDILTNFNLTETVEHVTNVSKKSEELALRFGVDVEKAKLAGMLHDISVFIPNNDRVEIAKSLNIKLCAEEIDFPMIIHQKLSKEIARKYFDIEDEQVLSAISCHTTLKDQPTKLDMIVFLADKISWDQEGKPPYLEVIINGLEMSLVDGAFNFVNYLIENKEKLRVVHPWLVDAYNYFKLNKIGE